MYKLERDYMENETFLIIQERLKIVAFNVI